MVEEKNELLITPNEDLSILDLVNLVEILSSRFLNIPSSLDFMGEVEYLLVWAKSD